MITMELLGKIKRLYFRDKKSLHEIAKYTGLSRNTIRKWVRAPKAEDALKYVRQDMPAKQAPYQAEIEQALAPADHLEFAASARTRPSRSVDETRADESSLRCWG